MPVIISVESKKYTRDDDYIATGQFGQVFRARDDANNPVAIKRMTKKGNPAHEKLHKTEIVNHQQAVHENIIRILACESTNSEHLLVMELAPEGSLWDQLIANEKEQVSFTKQQLLHIRRDVSAALSYLHLTLLMVHGDVKPDNILQFRRPNGERIYKIGDFGFSKQLLSHDDVAGDSFYGTLRCAAPEVISGTPYGLAADMWSFGILLYICSTLLQPWHEYLKRGTDYYAAFIDQITQADVTQMYHPRFKTSPEYPTVKTLLLVDPARRATSKQVFDQAEKEKAETSSRIKAGK